MCPVEEGKTRQRSLEIYQVKNWVNDPSKITNRVTLYLQRNNRFTFPNWLVAFSFGNPKELNIVKEKEWCRLERKTCFHFSTVVGNARADHIPLVLLVGREQNESIKHCHS